MNRPIVMVGALVTLGFAVTLAVLWIQGARGVPAASPGRAPLSGVRSPADLPGPGPRAEVTATELMPTTPPRAQSAPDPSSVVPPSDDTGPPLPMLLAISSRPGRIEDEADDRTVRSTRLGVERQVDLYSNASEPLQITVLTTNMPTQETTRVQVLVLPHGQAHVGAESGLKLDPGDLVAVRSGGYQELTQTVR